MDPVTAFLLLRRVEMEAILGEVASRDRTSACDQVEEYTCDQVEEYREQLQSSCIRLEGP